MNDDAHPPPAEAALHEELERARQMIGSDGPAARALACDIVGRAQSHGAPTLEAAARMAEGAACDVTSDYEAALEAFATAERLFDATGDRAGIAAALRAAGNVLDTLGDFPEALERHLAAIAIADELGDERSRADGLRTAGVSVSKSGDPEMGIAYYRRSHEICARLDDRLGCARSLNNIGINLKNLGRLEDSLIVLQQARDAFAGTGLLVNQAACLSNIGHTLERLGRLPEARDVLEEAARLAVQSGYQLGVANARAALGRVAMALGEFDRAQAQLAESLEIAEAAQARPEVVEARRALSDLARRRGDFRAALDHFEAYHRAERALFNAESDRKHRGLQVRHQVREARREAEIHRLRNVDLAAAYERVSRLNASLELAAREKEALLAELERQTHEDALTGLFNRRYLDRRLAEEFARARRHRQPLTVALADADYFKRINDSYTHASGDAALRQLAGLLRAGVRSTDIVARYGGEEFALLLIGVDREDATAVCEALRANVEGHDWNGIAPGLRVTLSIGVCADTALATHERMLAAADAALFRAKEGGRNRVCT